MMNLLGNKSFTQVLLDKEGNATKDPSKDPQAINPDQGLIDASSELIKAVGKGDPQRVARCFKAMMALCEREDEDEGSEY
jgi:hypothetical protein